MKKKKSNSIGATFVEAAIILIIYFGAIGGFFTFALVFHHYSALADALTSTLRRVSVNVNLNDVNQNYSPLQLINSTSDAYIGNHIKQFLVEHAYTSRPDEIVVNPADVSICRDINGLCQITVKAVWHTPCFFCIYTSALNVNIQVQSGFEDPCFISNAGSGCDTITPGECVYGS